MFGYDVASYPYDEALVTLRVPCLLNMMYAVGDQGDKSKQFHNLLAASPNCSAVTANEQSLYFMQNLTETGPSLEGMTQAYNNAQAEFPAFCDVCAYVKTATSGIAAIILGYSEGTYTNRSCFVDSPQEYCCPDCNMSSYVTVTTSVNSPLGQVGQLYLSSENSFPNIISQKYFASIPLSVMTLFQMFFGDSWSSGKSSLP